MREGKRRCSAITIWGQRLFVGLICRDVTGSAWRIAASGLAFVTSSTRWTTRWTFCSTVSETELWGRKRNSSSSAGSSSDNSSEDMKKKKKNVFIEIAVSPPPVGNKRRLLHGLQTSESVFTSVGMARGQGIIRVVVVVVMTIIWHYHFSKRF